MNEDIIKMALEARLFDDDMENYSDRLEAFHNLAVVAEREACAKVCEDYGTHNITVDCAAAIRARSQS